MVIYLRLNARSYSCSIVLVSYRLRIFFNFFQEIKRLFILPNTPVFLPFLDILVSILIRFSGLLWFGDCNKTWMLPSSVFQNSSCSLMREFRAMSAWHSFFSSIIGASNTANISASASVTLTSWIISVNEVSSILCRSKKSLSESAISMKTFSLLIELLCRDLLYDYLLNPHLILSYGSEELIASTLCVR